MQKAKKYDWKDSNMALFGSDTDKAVKKESAETEPAWQSIRGCEPPALFVFRIEKFKVVPWDKEEYGTFYTGDSYIVLNVYKNEDEVQYDVHFWIGKYSTQDEYGTAAYKTVELDTFFDDKPIQHREVQGHESHLFKSYFPTIQILKGGAATGFRRVEAVSYQPRLLHVCKQDKNISVREISLKKGHINSDDVFILDLGNRIIQFNGASCTHDEKYKAAQFVKQIKGQRLGNTRVDVVEEGSAGTEEFLGYLKDGLIKEKSAEPKGEKKMMRLTDMEGKMEFSCILEGSLDRSLISEEDCYIIAGTEALFVYVGAECSVDERKNCLSYGSNYLNKTETPWLPITVVSTKTAEKAGLNTIWD